MLTFFCENCLEVNKVEMLETTDSGDWVIICECGHRHPIMYDFTPFEMMERVISDIKLSRAVRGLTRGEE